MENISDIRVNVQDVESPEIVKSSFVHKCDGKIVPEQCGGVLEQIYIRDLLAKQVLNTLKQNFLKSLKINAKEARNKSIEGLGVVKLSGTKLDLCEHEERSAIYKLQAKFFDHCAEYFQIYISYFDDENHMHSLFNLMFNSRFQGDTVVDFSRSVPSFFTMDTINLCRSVKK